MFSRHRHLSGVYLRFTTFGSGQKVSDANWSFVPENSFVAPTSK
jgi:hypothetical protein